MGPENCFYRLFKIYETNVGFIKRIFLTQTFFIEKKKFLSHYNVLLMNLLFNQDTGKMDLWKKYDGNAEIHSFLPDEVQYAPCFLS